MELSIALALWSLVGLKILELGITVFGSFEEEE